MQILTNLQEGVLGVFAETQEAELFYLTGGTALVGFYLQLRFSKDLDLFTKKEEVIGYMGGRLKANLEAKRIQARAIRRLKSFYEILASQEEMVVPIHLA